jgi:hypothetical protein
MSAEFLWINIPLMVLAFAIWVGVPLWIVLKYPDRHPRETRTVPGYLQEQAANRASVNARQRVPAYTVEWRRVASGPAGNRGGEFPERLFP